MIIKSKEHLKELIKGRNQLDTYVALKGNLRSSKAILVQDDGGITIVNEIDGSVEDFDNVEDLFNRHSIINGALEKNSFYVYDYELKKGIPK